MDIHTSTRLAALIPDEVVRVSESGIQGAQEVQMLESSGFEAILVGESLMRAADKRVALRVLRGDKER